MKSFHSIVLVHSFLVLYGFGCLQSSPFETSEKDKAYEKNRVEQARINQENTDSLTRFLAQQTEGFTYKELRDVVDRGVALARSSRGDKVVELHHFTTVIEQIKKDPKRKLEREKGTWKHVFKMYFRNPGNVVQVSWFAATMILVYQLRSADKMIVDLQKMLANQPGDEALLEYSNDAEKIDPELYEVFLKIKQDYGITDNVRFRILPPFNELTESQKSRHAGTTLMYLPIRKTVLIRNEYKQWPRSCLVHGIAHELEHHRQNKRMKGSYFDIDQDYKNNPGAAQIKKEIGADAAAADYVYCFECLKDIAVNRGFEHNPRETDFGYITSPEGYFSKKDYELYIDRAKEDCVLCPAHKTGTHKNPSTPLKNYLPPIIK